MIPKLATVVWWDAWTTSEPWNDMPTEYEPAEIHSTGYVLEYPNGLYIMLSAGTKAEDSVGPYTAIPRGCIRTIKYLD